MRFKKLQEKASQSHEQLPRAISYFNEHIAGFLRTKESWLQALSMLMVYSDIFLDELPSDQAHWELSSSATSSMLREQDSQSPQLAGRYRLAKEEYGKGGKEIFGMKAQLWVPVDSSSTDANVIVFRGTCLVPTVISAKKNLGTGMTMNMDTEGFGRTAFEDFWPIFGGWVVETRDSGRKLIATGHSLGGVIARRLHIRSYEVFSEWTTENVESVVFNAPGLEDDTSATLKEIPHAYHIANAGDVVAMIRWNPKSHLLVHHDPSSRIPPMSYLNFEESRRCHNHPGLLLNELRKVTLVTVNSKILPYTVSAAEGLQPTVLSQFYAAGFRCASWALRRIIKRLLMDPCVSLDAWRLELRADGMAEKVVVAPWFDAILPSVKDLIWIQAPSLVKSMRSQVWKQVLSSFPHMDHLQLHPTI